MILETEQCYYQKKQKLTKKWRGDYGIFTGLCMCIPPEMLHAEQNAGAKRIQLCDVLDWQVVHFFCSFMTLQETNQISFKLQHT